MRTLFVLLAALTLTAGESFLTKNGVTVSVEMERDALGPVIVATFQPRPQAPPLHLYSRELKPGGAGVATSVVLAPGSPVRARGPVTDDQPTHDLDGLLVYPEGAAVTLKLPITQPAGVGEIPIEVRVSYMACTTMTCLVPVANAPLTLLVPGDGVAVVATAAQGPSLADVRSVVREEIAGAEQRLQTAFRHEITQATEPGGTRWRRPSNRATAEALIAEGRAAGKPVFLDFTGASCVNCQLMAKTVFRLPAVIRALDTHLPVEIDTDPPHDELAAWQQERFATQNRPLYVRIAADGSESRWDRVFAPGDAATLERFLAFLDRGASTAGDVGGTGTGWGEFLLLAVFGGLFTLVMPCTYPMIPFTVNVFTKQAAAGHRLLPLAAFYALGIIACFVGLGVLITGVFGASLTSLAGHPVTNLLIGAMFVLLGLSLLGAWFLRPPTWLQNLSGGSRGGYLGALVMGLTFAITAFTCTAPFAGAVLAAGVSHGAWGSAILGMAIYSGTIALPFFLLALAPGMLSRMPRAGAWMNEFKIVGGLIEVAAALKFLAICDHAWGWGIIGRTLSLSAWSAIALAIAIYVMGWWRHEGDDRIEHVGLGRLSTAIICTALAVWLASGLTGNHLGLIESFFPGDAAP